MDNPTTYTAFEGERRLAAGAPWDVALAVKAALDVESMRSVLTFDDKTGRIIDFDLRGSDEELVARLKPAADIAPEPRSPGRPKLGVVAREVTLLPRHWEWLAAQPGGASVALRKLVDAARAENGGGAQLQQAQEAADRFMSAMLGDQPGYEEAARALYAGDGVRFHELIERWPVDLRDHVKHLATPALNPADRAGRGRKAEAGHAG
jgi:hypothetical protein